ncbi:hypothetical protein TNCV_517101 [Trichonephila clavipes]|nr:hypothetical protein TNCV_517101 [Trichonephila clavipes]
MINCIEVSSFGNSNFFIEYFYLFLTYTRLVHHTVTKPITSPQLLRTPHPCRQSCGNSTLFINSWEGISELGPRRHKETHQQFVLFAPDPLTTARLETQNVYPDIGTRGARSGMRRN